MMRRASQVTVAAVLLTGFAAAWAGPAEEFAVKPQPPFEFAQPPAVTREGANWVIRFATKAYSDVTVAIEDANGRIVRHLACGCLGSNAPAPLASDSLSQSIVWDGKDDRGRYIDRLDGHRVRVSLGLRARFERNLFWSANRRVSREPPLMAATPEGMLVFDGGGFNHLRLFDADGQYVRTVYPFPRQRIDAVKGLFWRERPQDGKRLAIKLDFAQTAMLTSGTNTQDAITWRDDQKTYESVIGTIYHRSMSGVAAMTMASQGQQIALAHLKVNRLALDGSSGGLPLEGPDVSYPVLLHTIHNFKGGVYPVSPHYSALSPDGKWLYLSGYYWDWQWHKDGLHGLVRVNYRDGDGPEIFAGSMEKDKKGSRPGEFRYAMGVACDARGRVYVADYMNDRIQVFEESGKFIKAIPVSKPLQLWIHPTSGDIFVGSWFMQNNELAVEDHRRREQRLDKLDLPPQLIHLGPLDDPKVKARHELPLERYRIYGGGTGHEYRLELNFHTDPITVWAVCWGPPGARNTPISASLPRVFELTAKGLTLKADPAPADRDRLTTLEFKQRTRLYVNPATGRLYVAMGQEEDGTGAGKAFKSLVEIDPETGRCRQVDLPFDGEDIAFGPDGMAYLRGFDDVGRYDPRTWREVPWDYGDERDSVGFSSSSGGRRAKVVAAIRVPGTNWHLGGMSVSPRGRMAITWYIHDPVQDRRTDTDADKKNKGQNWQPRIYPGRVIGGKRAIVQVYDAHGQVLYEDAVPGLGILHGVQIDNNDDLYLLSTAARVWDGQRYFNDMAGTLMKFTPGKGRLISTDKDVPVKMSEPNLPKRSHDLINSDLSRAWVEGAHWMFAGIGWGGKNRGVGCDCINCQFSMDYFARCFVPETDRYSVAVLDSRGNLMLRIGDYGNADDGRPLDDENGPPNARSIGGDEVALYHGAYVATHTDNRVFICDVANDRIVSVKLDYHASRSVSLTAGPGPR